MHLDSNARRELVNYITGVGIDIQSVMSGPKIGWSERIDLGFDHIVGTLADISSGENSAESIFKSQIKGLLMFQGPNQEIGL